MTLVTKKLFIKKEASNVILLKQVGEALGSYSMDREDIKQSMQVIMKVTEDVKKGKNFLIFPEGTRNRNAEGTVLDFKGGSFKIATKSGCPIIPMAISNSAAIWENHLPFMKRTHVILEYGKPIYPNELSKEEQKHLGAYCQKGIQAMLDKNKDLV